MNDLFDLSDRVALVTGASQGLGQRFARVLAEHGAAVGLAARQLDKLATLEREIGAGGGGSRASRSTSPTTRASSVRSPPSRTCSARSTCWSTTPAWRCPRALLEQTEADWDKVIDTNLKGAFFVAQAVAKRMVARDPKPAWGGNIVNIASVLALAVVGHLAPYAASKGGLWQLTQATMALELARHDVRVNALAPGYIRDRDSIARSWRPGPRASRMRAQRIPQRRFGHARGPGRRASCCSPRTPLALHDRQHHRARRRPHAGVSRAPLRHDRRCD